MFAETLIAPALPAPPFATSDLPFASEQRFMLPQQMNGFTGAGPDT